MPEKMYCNLVPRFLFFVFFLFWLHLPLVAGLALSPLLWTAPQHFRRLNPLLQDQLCGESAQNPLFPSHLVVLNTCLSLYVPPEPTHHQVSPSRLRQDIFQVSDCVTPDSVHPQ